MLLNLQRLNTHGLNTLGTPAEPQPQDITLTPPALVSALRWGGAQVQVLQPQPVLQLWPAPLVARMHWGQPALQLVLAAPSLRGGRLGTPTASLVLHPAALHSPLRAGGARLQLVLTPAPLLAPLRLGRPTVSTVQGVQSLVSRLSWGAVAVVQVLHPQPLRGGRLGRPVLQSLSVIEVTQGLGPMRWGAHRLQVVAHPLPLSARARLGRPLVQWEAACPC